MEQIQDGNVVVTEHSQQHYRTIFNRRTGFFARKEDKGYEEPFWAKDGPELLDVSITSYCERVCTFCYRQANKTGKHMPLSDVKSVIEQAKNAGVLQIALGGGNPNQHPHFIEILKRIHDSGIVPSYTSNGEGLSDNTLVATKKYCGAMAISLYPQYSNYENLTKRIRDFGIKLNLHVILKIDTVDLLTEWLMNPPSWFCNLNAIIVLNYKPVPKDDYIVKDASKLKAFYDAVSRCKSVKVGFDSCCIPGIVSCMNIDSSLIESCEAARFSAFISEDMKMYPCSFMAGTEMYGDLRSNSLLDVWRNNMHFIDHRSKIQNNPCNGCKHQNLCNGGCVFLPQINQCSYITTSSIE